MQTNKIFKEKNLFTLSDFREFNLYPFNYNFKISAKNTLRKPRIKMHTFIEPRFNEINNPIFFNLFRIKYLLILNDEISLLNQKLFLKKISLQLSENKTLHLFERKNLSNISVNNLNDVKKMNNFQCKKYEVVSCLLNKKNFFIKNTNLKISRVGLNTYNIVNNNSQESAIAILPFSYDKNWKALNGKTINIKETFVGLQLDPLEKNVFFYEDDIRRNLKLISLIIIFSSLLYFILFEFKIFRINRKKL